jgi:predicted TIM-barrel fold metal-dependent hydrolase
MQNDSQPVPPYRGNRHRSALELSGWHERALAEPVVEPELPIVDPHHHLYGKTGDTHFYRHEDLCRDLACGHRVMGTVYMEAYHSEWREDGPPAMRSLGEVEMIVRESRRGAQTPHGHCQVAAGIVSNVDLTLGEAAAGVIEAHKAAADGRLRGVRHHTTHDTGTAGRYVYNSPPRLMADAAFRRGFACLEPAGLSFDAFVFHTQLEELAELAEAFPRVPIVLNHVGTMIKVAEYADRRAEVRAQWDRGLRVLARQPNVYLKVGGLGMPVFAFGFEHQPRPATSAELVSAWQPIIDTCIDVFGSHRCMFESNFPVDKQSCGYTQLWNALKLATRARGESERRDVFYRTACRVYRLPALERACDEAFVEAA